MLITKPAVKIEQDGKILFLTHFAVSDLGLPGFYRVEELESDNDRDYQRVLDARRAKRFADYIKAAHKEKHAFLPTSIFLATRANIDFDESKREIRFATEEACPFYMVDGQHRASGLKMAAQENGELMQFPLAVVIAANMGKNERMVQFLIVNSTQKRVDKALESRMRARFAEKEGVETLPFLPEWVKKEIGSGVDSKIRDLVNHLNESERSPWRGKIQLANQKKTDSMSASQTAFDYTLKKSVLVLGHPLALERDEQKRRRMLENYWRAIAGLFAEEELKEAKNLFTGAGVRIFHMASMSVFSHLAKERCDFSEEAFTKCLRTALDLIDEEHAGMTRPQWWRSGGEASGINPVTARHFSDALSNAVGRIEIDADTGIKL